MVGWASGDSAAERSAYDALAVELAESVLRNVDAGADGALSPRSVKIIEPEPERDAAAAPSADEPRPASAGPSHSRSFKRSSAVDAALDVLAYDGTNF